MGKSTDPEYKSFTWLILVACSTSIGTITQSFQIYSINDALKSMLIIFEVDEEQKTIVEGVIGSSIFIGCFIGALFSSYFLKISGRKAIIIIDTLMIIGSILQSFTDPYIFLLGRIIGGIGSGVHFVIVPLYLRQIAPKQIFGFMAGINQISYAMGYVLADTLGLMLELADDATIEDINYNTLKIYFLAPSIFSLIRILLFIFYIDFDSPQQYIEQNQITKAQEIVSRIYKQEYIKTNLENLYSQRKKQAIQVNLFSNTYRLRFYLALAVNTLYALCGQGAIQQYTTLIFLDSLSERMALILSFSLSIMKLLSFISITVITQKVGRRTPFLVGNSVMCATLLGIGFTSYAVESMALNSDTMQHLKYFIISLIFVYLIAMNNSIGFLAAVYIPEIVPGIGVAITYQLLWFLTILTLFGFPIFKKLVGSSTCFFFFAFSTICGQWLLHKFALETSNKNETEIDDIFDDFRLSQTIKRRNKTIQRSSTLGTSMVTASEY